jgi:hypothetical protein
MLTSKAANDVEVQARVLVKKMWKKRKKKNG